MSRIETIRRVANISEEAARDGIASRFPGSEIVSLERQGRHFVAQIKVAEFPFDKKKKDEDAEAPDAKDKSFEEDAPSDDDAGDDSPTHGDGDSDPEGGGDDPLGDEEGDDEGDAEPSIKEVMGLLQKICDHLHIPVDDGLGEDAPPELHNGEGLDLPDVGAPPAGDPMGAPGDAPLPPPVPAPSKPGLAFSHVLQRKVGSRRSFVARRVEAGEVSNKQIITEALSGFPGYRVARINREDDGTASVAMVAKAG